MRKGEAINPGNPADPLRQRAINALFTGRFQEAISLLLEVQHVTKGHAFDYFLGLAYYYNGQQAQAKEVLSPMRGNAPADRRAQAILASFFAADGDRLQAELLVRTLTGPGVFLDHHVMYSLGVAYLYLGNRAEAMQWLRKAADTGLVCYPWYRQDPLLDPLRNDADFQRFLAAMRASWESAQAKYRRES